MTLGDDEDPSSPRTGGLTLLPVDLAPYSVEELARAIDTLRAEITRLEAAITAKTRHRDSAENLFRR